jgi:primosomal protein N' (replication factor Y)
MVRRRVAPPSRPAKRRREPRVVKHPSYAASPAVAPGALRFARVAIGRPLEQLYTYLIPDALSRRIAVGALVQVPLRTETAAGVVIDISGAADVPARVRGQIKPIGRRLSPDYILTPELIELGRWMADYYFCSLGEALASISMVGLNDVSPKTLTHLVLARPERWLGRLDADDEMGRRPTAGHQRVIRALLDGDNRPAAPAELKELAEAGDGVLKTMLDREWLHRVQEPVFRLDEESLGEAATETIPADKIRLTARQSEVYSTLGEALRAATFQPFLLHGVTGSGKTEIYLRIIADALHIGRTAIVLAPEIALTPQIVEAFRRRLGRVVGVYHSRLSLGQKLDLFRLVQSNEVRVIIGARSALFTPLARLGVVIVDEEHETSYKQAETPRYHARDVAVIRAQRAGALIVLGSATPSIESLHNAREGKYKKLTLPERIGPHASPQMTVVDMKRHIAHAGGDQPISGLLSPALRVAIAARLRAGEQTVLLLNRRGFANHVLCLRCEQQIQCPNCDVAMTYHKAGEKLLCHWCGERAQLPKTCPNPKCGAAEIQVLGFGTQRIEESLAEAFPRARLLRIDMDSMRRKGAHREAWRRIVNREVDIILGTQMIAKGLHLESVTLVGVISADFALFMPDFRSAERTYQLLTQVAGRAGRGNKPGEVIVQSFMPHHYAIDCAARLAEGEFYERELRLRELTRFPPFSRLAAMIVTGPDEKLVRDHAYRLAGILKRLVYGGSRQFVKILGPTPAPIARLDNQYRWRLLARSGHVRQLHEVLRQGLRDFAGDHKRSRINLTVDIDPTDLM